MQRQYTTKEQGRKLIELGLEVSTSDMHYRTTIDGVAKTADIPTFGSIVTDWDIPCWSLTALIELMPNIRTKYGIIRCKMDKEEKSKFPYIFYYLTVHTSDHCEAPVDAAFEMVCWLLENKYIKEKNICHQG